MARHEAGRCRGVLLGLSGRQTREYPYGREWAGMEAIPGLRRID